jgi:hypothetical protein
MKLIFVVSFLLSSLLSYSQKSLETNQIDAFIERFNLKMDTVNWLCEYDDIAWWTSDSVYMTPKEEQARLGSEWFCFRKEKVWHALYGKYQDNQFVTVYHYEVDSLQIIRRVSSPVDTSILNSSARALVNGSKQVNNFPDSVKVRFNQYIRRNPDNSLSVWFLPAFTAKGIAVYGGEFYYLFDASGNNLISKTEYSQGYKGFQPNPKKEIWLNYEGREEPTLGSIFFIWYYRKYFERIVVDAKKIKSTLFHEKDKGYYWVHAVKE